VVKVDVKHHDGGNISQNGKSVERSGAHKDDHVTLPCLKSPCRRLGFRRGGSDLGGEEEMRPSVVERGGHEGGARCC
jgi:hypothetical protein